MEVDGLAALKHQTPEQKKVFDDNYDLIFNKKSMSELDEVVVESTTEDATPAEPEVPAEEAV